MTLQRINTNDRMSAAVTFANLVLIRCRVIPDPLVL